MQAYRSIGTNIDAWCTRCRLMLAHTIEAALGQEIKRVHCNTCLSKHQYRANPPGEKTPKQIRPKIAEHKKMVSKSKPYDLERLLQERDVKTALPYNIKTEFTAGDIIAHIKFGLGIVTEVKEQQKIEVLFPMGAKILVHKRI
jgi:hypothetical protein